MESRGAMQSRISFRLPMLTLGGVKPWTGSKIHRAGRKNRRTFPISGAPNFTRRRRPDRSPEKSGVMMFFISAPARRSFFRSFLRMLSSVVRNVIFMGSRENPGGSRTQAPPRLRAAMMWHQRVVFPTPPSAAMRVICPAGIQPGTSHFVSSSGNSSRGLNRDRRGSWPHWGAPKASPRASIRSTAAAISSVLAPFRIIRWSSPAGIRSRR